MGTRFPGLDSRPIGHQTGRRRRVTASLLVGWVAFWLNTAVLACCAGLTQDVKATGEAALMNGPPAALSPSDGGDPLRSACTDLTAPTGVAAPTAPVPNDRPDDRAVGLTASIHNIVVPSVSSPATPRFAFSHPPHVPLYLRTARLLI